MVIPETRTNQNTLHAITKVITNSDSYNKNSLIDSFKLGIVLTAKPTIRKKATGSNNNRYTKAKVEL